MKRWNERADLQVVFTGANLAANPIDLVIWSGRANVLANEFNSDLVPTRANIRTATVLFPRT